MNRPLISNGDRRRMTKNCAMGADSGIGSMQNEDRVVESKDVIKEVNILNIP